MTLQELEHLLYLKNEILGDFRIDITSQYKYKEVYISFSAVNKGFSERGSDISKVLEDIYKKIEDFLIKIDD